MSNHPYRDVAIVAVHNTRQARVLEGATSLGLMAEATLAVLHQAGVPRSDVNGVVGADAAPLTYALGLGPVWSSTAPRSASIRGVLDAANAIAAGMAETVVVAGANAGMYTERDSTAPWTRPQNEFVVAVGLYTAVEFALIARRHMDLFGTLPEHLAHVAAVIRNNGHENPDAVYFGRGPFTPADILASRMIADPFHLLDCSMTSEGGAALLMTTADRAVDLVERPVYILGGGMDQMGPSYTHPPAWDLTSADGGIPNGYIGRRAAQRAFATAGLRPEDVDLIEFYDPFSFEIIRKLEAYGFCADGEGGEFVADGNIDRGGRYPINSDGGLMSYSHSSGAQALQRVTRGVEQLQGTCRTAEVADPQVALCDNFGAGALFDDVLLLGRARP